MSSQATGSTPASDPILEIRSTRETAEKIAKDGATEGTDVPRLLAGLIAHLAGQMEQLASGVPLSDRERGQDQGHEESAPQNADAIQEEDVSPRDAPAAPARDLNVEAS